MKFEVREPKDEDTIQVYCCWPCGTVLTTTPTMADEEDLSSTSFVSYCCILIKAHQVCCVSVLTKAQPLQATHGAF